MIPEHPILSQILAHADNNQSALIVSDKDHQLTWAEFVCLASTYAQELQHLEHEAVAILVDRTVHTPAAFLACMLAGKAFVPLSADQPEERIYKSLNQISCPVVFSFISQQLSFFETGEFKPIGYIKTSQQSPAFFSSTQAISKVCYVLFTSGSTGAPKGVIVTVSNLLNTLLWSRLMLDWTNGDVIGLSTNFFFDISIFDLFTSLFFNIPLHILSNPKDPLSTVSEIREREVTSLFSAPIFYSSLLRAGLVDKKYLGVLRRIIAGGDFFPPKHLLDWITAMPELSIYNVWGPTETSIVNTMHRITEDDIRLLTQNLSVPVGREHAMMPIRIWNPQTKELITRPNEQGEILMLGDCVSLGYLGDPERTAEAYVEYQNQRAYRTGDIGYFDGDDNLFIVGRIGTAVKVNGYRVDLMEVDAAACSLSDVHLASAFLLQSDEYDLSSVQLCMAVEPKPDCNLDIFQLKQSLRTLLPPYMVPKRIFIFESLPKNSNGKLDRRTIVADVKSRFNP